MTDEMRLTPYEIDAIRTTTRRLVGKDAIIWLFGSRADDSLRGGDIDLLIETDDLLPNRALTLSRLYGALIFSLGERKLDILLKDGRTTSSPIYDVAKRTGVRL